MWINLPVPSMMGVVMRFAVWKQVLDDGTGAGGYANVPRLRPSALAPPLFRYTIHPIALGIQRLQRNGRVGRNFKVTRTIGLDRHRA